MFVLRFHGWNCATHNAVRRLFVLLCVTCIISCDGSRKLLRNQNPKLTKVPSGLTPDITILDLAKNDISELGPDNFTGLSSLLDLNLAANRIAHIDNLAFISCLSLTMLNLEGNQIVHMPTTYGPNSQNMVTLRIHNNPCIIEFPWLQQFRSLNILHVDGSGMQELPNDMFRGLQNLKQLGIYNSNVPNLTSRTANLELLMLNNHKSNIFPQENFMNLTKLTMVMIMGGSHMAVLPRFMGAMALEQVIIMNLDIQSLPDLSQLSALKRLTFPISSMICDHRLCWTLFEKYTFPLGELENGCSNPPQFVGRGITDISKLELGCYNSKFLYSCVNH